MQGSPFRELSPEEEDERVQRQLRAYLAAGVTTVLDDLPRLGRARPWLEPSELLLQGLLVAMG